MNNHEIHFVSEKLSLNNIFRAQNCNAISIFSSDTCDKSFIEKFNKMGIQLILLRSAGYDNVDLSTAQKYKIKVARVPDYSPEAIAEHIITLILAISRNIYAGQLRVSQLNFSLVGLMGFNLSDKTVGVIGTGKIGSSLIKILKGFGSKILAHDLIENKTFKNDASVQYVTKTELLQKSDIVSLNLPLNEHTFHYIDFEEIEMMQNQSILINTSRGAILNTQALLKGIDSGKISRAGIDVYENEKEYFFSNLYINLFYI